MGFLAAADLDAGTLDGAGFVAVRVSVDLGVVVGLVVVLVVAEALVVDGAFLEVVVVEVGGLADSVALTTAVPDLEGAFEDAGAGLVGAFAVVVVFEVVDFAGAVFASVAETVFVVLAVDLTELDLARVADRVACVVAVGFAGAADLAAAAGAFAVRVLGLGIFDGRVFASFAGVDLCAFSSQKVARGLRWLRGASEPAVNATGALRAAAFAVLAFRVACGRVRNWKECESRRDIPNSS